MTLPELRTFRTAALSFAVAGSLTLSSAMAHAQTNSTYPQQQTNSNQSQAQQNHRTYNQNQQTNRDQMQQNEQKGVNSSTTDMSVPDTDAPHNWTQNQILTATVHQAWELSGKNEANFFEIVKELAEISARNRNLTLPDDSAAGRRAGEYIKQQAKADHDQLLYAIVDKSVQMTGKPAPASASNTDNNPVRNNSNSPR